MRHVLTKKQRDEVVMVLRCAVDLVGFEPELGHPMGATGLDAVPDALKVWQAAFYDIVHIVDFGDATGGAWWCCFALELAALLEDGWNPGEPVERLP